VSDDKLRAAYEQILSRWAAGSRKHCIPPEDLLASAEQRLTRNRELEVLDHIMGCRPCREDFELLRAIRKAKTVIERPGNREAE
jgi:hypothetical protein